MFPNATIPERIADGAMHAIGVLGALIGAITLLVWASGMVSAGVMISLAVYGAALLATFAASAAYNMMPFDGPRPLLRRIDHAAIYLKIAGTYTPLVVMIGSGFAYLILAVVWALAVLGHHAQAVFLANARAVRSCPISDHGMAQRVFDLGACACRAKQCDLADCRWWFALYSWRADLCRQDHAVFHGDLAWVCRCGIGVFLCRNRPWRGDIGLSASKGKGNHTARFTKGQECLT